MDFELNDDQKAVRDVVRAFARDELAEGYLRRAVSSTFPWGEHRRVADLGVLALFAGPEHNPLGREDAVAAGAVIEELAYADFNVANGVIPVLLTSSLLAQHAVPAVRDHWLPPLVAGETYLAFALTEPQAGSDVAAVRTTAAAGDEGFVLSGEKTSVTMVAHASAVLVTARTVRDGEQVGPSVFLVDLHAEGVTIGDIPDTGWHPMGRGSVHLDGVRVPTEALVGPEGSAFRSVLGGFDVTRPLLALTGIACAQWCLDVTVQYARDREAFGEPLARYEGVSFPLAEHTTMLEAARLVCYSTLWRRGVGTPHTAEAAMAKWLGPQVASAAVKDCVLTHGHYGYAQEAGLEQRLRDVMAVEIADGTAQVQKMIIARERFGREFLPYSR